MRTRPARPAATAAARGERKQQHGAGRDQGSARRSERDAPLIEPRRPRTLPDAGLIPEPRTAVDGGEHGARRAHAPSRDEIVRTPASCNARSTPAYAPAVPEPLNTTAVRRRVE